MKTILIRGIAVTMCCFLAACQINKNNKNDQVDPNAIIFTGNSQGNRQLPESPYGYELWSQSGNDNRLIWYGPNTGGGGAFRAEWNNADTFLGRVGLFWNQGKPYTAYGDVSCDFSFERSANGTAGGTSYIGIYGWSRNPLIEWYIVDDWFLSGVITPSRIGGGATKKGEFTVDGEVYFIYEATRVQKPSIDGTRTFQQYFSVRQTTRQSGTISITEHFKEWERIGLPLGTNMYEAKFLIEAGGGTGWIDVNYLSFAMK